MPDGVLGAGKHSTNYLLLCCWPPLLFCHHQDNQAGVMQRAFRGYKDVTGLREYQGTLPSRGDG